MKKIAVIVAGGTGSRMGSLIPKQFLLLHGKPIIWYTLHTFLQSYDDMEIRLILPESAMKDGNKMVNEFQATKRISVIKGGETRFYSVKNGLETIKDESIIFVHDGVRCLVSKDLIKRCYEQAMLKGSAVPSVSSVDSIRLVEGNKNRMFPRDNVQIIQTPQTFKSTLLLPAFNQAFHDFFTDEASVVEYSGEEIHLIEGEYSNIKITRKADLILAEHILKNNSL